MAGSIYTFIGYFGGYLGYKDGGITTSQGTVIAGQSGLFLSNEHQAAIAQGINLVPGPAISPSQQLSAPSLAVGAAGLPNGAYRCCVTFVTAAGETIAGPEAAITVSSEQISWSSIPTGSAVSGVLARRLYRTIAGGAAGSEKLVATISDNTTTTFTDNVADGSLGAGLPVADTAGVISGGVISGETLYAELTGNPADDIYAISAGTGLELSLTSGEDVNGGTP